MSGKWEYGGVYRDHDLTGEIEVTNGTLKVCDLTEGIPDFMLEADTIFVDPPCSQGNLRTFFTKADKDLQYKFDRFLDCLFTRIDEIQPDHLFVEVFKSNRKAVEEKVAQRYSSIHIYESHYYRKKANQCWIIHGNNSNIDYLRQLSGIDEADAIKWICANHQYEVIGDLCMGQGLVGKHAFLNKKRFVGTELNRKRLGVLVDFIKKNEFK